ANIAECVNPLFDYMNNYLLPAGKRAAKGLYGTKGMVVHHLSDVYGFARAADGPWGLWPMGGAWLAYHMWEHYLYSTDKDFLREVAYEYIKECVRFAEENLFEGRDGHLHTGPSMSPENPFYVEENGKKKKIYITVSPTMDVQIVGGLFDLYRECEKLLSIDPPYAKLIKEKRARLLPMRVGRHGQLMEWRCDYEEAEPGHRHVSHAFGLYPGAQITRQTPELLDALTVTFRRRLSSGGGHTGWSRAWLINLFARLRDGEAAHENIRALFTNSTLDNLLDTHPPFQIDGNFGGAAGIGEMLLQSHEGLLSLLPALPECLQDGSFTGLRARGGLTVDAEWKSGRITALTVTSKRPTKVKIELPEEDVFEAQINGKTVIK
ncbi:MAG: glycoside hydrolase family 95 protein, partial [Clostridia bacterium]|nr:glycoside hydrolase family 95 protein [Clostridia bacterium]